MSFMDKAKDALTQAKGKAADLAEQHGDKIDQGINKAGTFVDKKTGGKYADKIDQAQTKARAGAGKLAADRPATGGPVVGEPPIVVAPVVDPMPDPNVVHPIASEEPGVPLAKPTSVPTDPTV